MEVKKRYQKYYEEHKIEILEKEKLYFQKNKEKIYEKRKSYPSRIERFDCECGANILKRDLNKHLQSKKHSR